MARLRTKGPGATRLVRDDDLVPMPIMPWGTVHNLSPTEAAAARNATAISADSGVVSIIAIGGGGPLQAGQRERRGDRQRPLPARGRVARAAGIRGRRVELRLHHLGDRRRSDLRPDRRAAIDHGHAWPEAERAFGPEPKASPAIDPAVRTGPDREFGFLVQGRRPAEHRNRRRHRAGLRFVRQRAARLFGLERRAPAGHDRPGRPRGDALRRRR